MYERCVWESVMKINDNEFISFLIGTSIPEKKLREMGIKIIEGNKSSFKLVINNSNVSDYLDLIKLELSPGYWNEIIGKNTIFIVFKLYDGSIKEIKYSKENKKEIAELFSELNNDPIEKTSNVLKYLSGNSYYKTFIEENYKI